jgi:short-subunit dehydrogenase
MSVRALITGSNRGIGRETARLFVQKGWSVALNGRDAGRLEAVASELTAVARETGSGATVVSIPGDVSDPVQCREIVELAVHDLGGLDVLVNNAALAMRGPFEELDPSVVDTIVRTNIAGPTNLTVAALPALKAARGSVVFVSSVAGLYGFPLVSIYAASKMALTALSQSMHAELAGSGVHVGLLHVGITSHDSDKAILSVDGSPYPLAPRPRAPGQDSVARAIYHMVRRRRRRMVLTPAGWVAAFFVQFFPRLLGAIVRRASARVHRIAK